jgi:hypothetical protein
MKMDIKVENGVIMDVKFKTFGCGAAIATSSKATELVKGKTIDEALKITNKWSWTAWAGCPLSRYTAACWPRRRCMRPSPTISGRLDAGEISA